MGLGLNNCDRWCGLRHGLFQASPLERGTACAAMGPGLPLVAPLLPGASRAADLPLAALLASRAPYPLTLPRRFVT